MLAGCLCLHRYTSAPVSGSKVNLLVFLEPGNLNVQQTIAPLLRQCAEHCSIGFGKAVLDVSCCDGMTHLKNTLLICILGNHHKKKKY